MGAMPSEINDVEWLLSEKRSLAIYDIDGSKPDISNRPTTDLRIEWRAGLRGSSI